MFKRLQHYWGLKLSIAITSFACKALDVQRQAWMAALS
jgi:hypothetical protein